MFPTTQAVEILLSTDDPWTILVKLIGTLIAYIALRMFQDSRLRTLAREAVAAVEEACLSGAISAKGREKTDAAVEHLKGRAWFVPVTTAVRLVLQAVFETRGVGKSSKVLLLLVLGLGLLAAPVAAQPSLPGATTTAYGSMDLSSLTPGAHGRQNDKGVRWPEDFTVSKVIVLVEVTDTKTGERYWVEPTEAAQKRACLHKALLAHTRFGAPVNKWNAIASLRADVDVKLRTALSTAAGRVAAQIPALVGRGDALIAQLVAELFAR